MTLIMPNNVANGLLADGDKLDQNFDTIVDWANQEAINRTGSVAMTGALLLSGPPVAANQAATKAYVDQLGLIGEVKMWPGTTEPTNYMFCRGQAISRATYATLFGVLGTSYGIGDGSTTFNLPDYKGRYPFGHNEGGTYGQLGVGQAFGNKDQTLSAHTHAGVDHLHPVNINSSNESADHSHQVPGIASAATAGGFGTSVLVSTGGSNAATTSGRSAAHTHSVNGATGAADRSLTTGSTGSGDGTNQNLPPSQSINFIIRVG